MFYIELENTHDRNQVRVATVQHIAHHESRVAPVRKASGARFCTDAHTDTLSRQTLRGC